MKECPIGLDKVHCPNCWFERDDECKYNEVMEEHSLPTKSATNVKPKPESSIMG